MAVMKLSRAAMLCGLLALVAAARAEPWAGVSAVDQSACVALGMAPEAIERGAESARGMVRACLVNSPPTTDLCARVPVPGVVDAIDQEGWYLKGCARLGLTSGHCQQLMDEVAEYCYATGNP